MTIIKTALACVVALAIAHQAQAGSFGWGKGTADNCEEMYSFLAGDVDSYLDRHYAEEVMSLPVGSRGAKFDEHDFLIDLLSGSISAMFDWCEANIEHCAREMEEVERRGCNLNPGVVTYNLDSRSGSWDMNCTNSTLMLPDQC